MSLQSNVDWVKAHIVPSEIEGKRILEVGSKCWPLPGGNGRDEPVITDYLLSLKPSRYIGIDALAGKNVTHVLQVEDLVEAFGLWSFDVVFCLEVLEHVQDWSFAVENMLAVLKPGGMICLTTRMPGFPRHGYPDDFWRFDTESLAPAFVGLSDLVIECDLPQGGIYIKGTKRKFQAHKVA